jgi:glycosyltransferase involved in cell wall biosynthesis
MSAQRLKVLEFVTNFCVGGTERQFLNLLDGLRPRAEVHVACFRADGPLLGELRGFEPPLPLSEYPIPSLRSPVVARRLLELVRYLRRHEIDVVHTTGLYPNVFGVVAAWLARTPVIIASVRDMGQMWRGDLRRVQRLTCRLADAVVTNAEAIAQRLRAEGYRAETIEVIHNGIVPVEPPPRLPGSGFRRDLGIPAAAPVVGVVARIDPLKGLDDFLDAAALVAARHPETRFLIVGGPAAEVGPEYQDQLRRRADRLGLGDRVFLTGARTDVPDILPELTVSVLPSLTEGLSNSLLEAMAAGKPVVATAVGGNPEIVEDGVTGFLVPANDPASLAAAIERLVASPGLAAELGRAGQARVAAEFTPERLVERTTELYRRLLRESRRGPRRRSSRRPSEVPAWPLAAPLTEDELSEERAP